MLLGSLYTSTFHHKNRSKKNVQASYKLLRRGAPLAQAIVQATSATEPACESFVQARFAQSLVQAIVQAFAQGPRTMFATRLARIP